MRIPPDSQPAPDVNGVAAASQPGESSHAMHSQVWTPAGVAADTAKGATYLARVAATGLVQAVGQEALRQLDLRPGQRVLEAGCGTGLFLDALATGVGPAGRVVGVDLSPDFVGIARQRATALGATVTVQPADILHLPFGDASFDAAHCERVLMHLADPTTALAELRRVLKPGGVMVAAETDWRGLRIDHPDQEFMALLLRRATAGIAQPGMGLQLVRCLADAGYQEIAVQPVIVGVRGLAMLALYGLDLAQAAGALVNDGLATRERVDAELAWLTEADRRGALFGYGGLIVASGRAPA